MLTTDHVLVEAWLLLRHRLHRRAAEQFWEALRAGVARIEPVTAADLKAAWAISEAFPDQDFSITDRTSFAVMERLGVHRAAALDDDFSVYRFGRDPRPCPTGRPSTFTVGRISVVVPVKKGSEARAGSYSDPRDPSAAATFPDLEKHRGLPSNNARCRPFSLLESPTTVQAFADWRSCHAKARLHVTLSGVVFMADERKSSRERVRAHRERLRSQGLRPIQIWVPDVRSKAFKAEAHRQSLAIAESPHEQVDQDFIDAVSDLEAP